MIKIIVGLIKFIVGLVGMFLMGFCISFSLITIMGGDKDAFRNSLLMGGMCSLAMLAFSFITWACS